MTSEPRIALLPTALVPTTSASATGSSSPELDEPGQVLFITNALVRRNTLRTRSNTRRDVVVAVVR